MKLSRWLCIVITILTATAATEAGPLNWTSGQYVLGSSGIIGYTLDLKASLSGNYHLAISNENDGNIWYGFWEEPSWTVLEHVVTVGLDSFFHPELGLWGNFPVIMYDESIGLELHSTMKAGSSWTSPETVEGADHVYDFQMCMDEFAGRHVIYTRVTTWGTELMYATDITAEWEHEQIDFIGPDHLITKMDIAVDSERKPHFVWADNEAGEIKYAVRTGPASFDVETAASFSLNYWLELRILDGDIPYFGFLDAPSNYVIKGIYKIGESFYGSVVATVPGTDVIYDVGLAAAVEEGVTISNLYYVYSTYHQLNYAYYDAGWRSAVIDEVSLGGSADEISAQWDGTRDAVGIAVRDNADSTIYFALGYVPSNPTPTPSPTPTYTPTPPPADITLDLGPDADYTAGDMMEGILDVENSGAAISADIYVLLEVFGEFWFAPGWTQSLDHYHVTLSAFESRSLEYLPEFTLPDPLSTGGPFYFHAAAFTPGTLEADTIISNVDTKAFSFI